MRKRQRFSTSRAKWLRIPRWGVTRNAAYLFVITFIGVLSVSPNSGEASPFEPITMDTFDACLIEFDTSIRSGKDVNEVDCFVVIATECVTKPALGDLDAIADCNNQRVNDFEDIIEATLMFDPSVEQREIRLLAYSRARARVVARCHRDGNSGRELAQCLYFDVLEYAIEVREKVLGLANED